MAVSSVSSTAANDLAAQASSTAGASDRFLKLLVAQMKNQDPLNPMDNAQVTSQMAQIQTVSGIEKLNGTVAGLTSQFVQMQALQGASLVGRDVIVPGNQLDIREGVGQGGFELSSAADAVKVEILSPSGQVVHTMQLGAQSAGMHSFNWDAGAATNDSGLRFRVSSTLGGSTTSATALMRDTVGAVYTEGGQLKVETLNHGIVAYSDVKAVS